LDTRWASRTRTMAPCPHRTASANGVCFHRSSDIGSAPCFSSICTTPRCPSQHAMWSGDRGWVNFKDRITLLLLLLTRHSGIRRSRTRPRGGDQHVSKKNFSGIRCRRSVSQGWRLVGLGERRYASGLVLVCWMYLAVIVLLWHRVRVVYVLPPTAGNMGLSAFAFSARLYVSCSGPGAPSTVQCRAKG
jgi:hypothetical protein